jgi:hypothetical protein
MPQAPSRQRPQAAPLAAATSRGASPVQRLYAAGYDWVFDRVDPLGGADHRRRLVEPATGEVLEIGAGTGRNLPRYRTATRVVALEPAPGMRARAIQAAQTAQDPRLARWQDRLERPWGWLALGCHPNPDVVAAITAAGFGVVELDRFDFQIMPPLVRPHVLGVAQRPTHPQLAGGSPSPIRIVNQASATAASAVARGGRRTNAGDPEPPGSPLESGRWR